MTWMMNISRKGTEKTLCLIEFDGAQVEEQWSKVSDAVC